VVREVAPDEAARCARHGPGIVWIDLEGEEEPAARALLEPLGIHPVALDDMPLRSGSDGGGGRRDLVVPAPPPLVLTHDPAG
jgi:hypothetical protein